MKKCHDQIRNGKAYVLIFWLENLEAFIIPKKISNTEITIFYRFKFEFETRILSKLAKHKNPEMKYFLIASADSVKM